MGEDLDDNTEATNTSDTHRENIARLVESIQGTTEMRSFDKKSDLDQALKDYADEFLTCYRIFGYDESGRMVAIDKSHNPMEKSALDSLFVEQFNSYFEKKMMGG